MKQKKVTLIVEEPDSTHRFEITKSARIMTVVLIMAVFGQALNQWAAQLAHLQMAFQVLAEAIRGASDAVGKDVEVEEEKL